MMPQALPSAAAARPLRPRARPLPPRQRMLPPVMRLMPILVVLYCCILLPPEVQITALGVNFPSYRIALLLMFLPALWRAFRDPGLIFGMCDAAIVVVGLWTLLSFVLIYDFEVGMVRGSAITIDTLVSYFIARSSIRSFDDLRYVLILIVPGLALAAVSLVLESLSGRLLVRPAFAAIFGNMSAFTGGVASGDLVLKTEYRLGWLMRAYGPFPHPILAGIMMIGWLPFYYFSGLRSWVFYGGIIAALAGFFGLSSAAFLALFLSLGAIAVFHIKAYVPKISWWTISALFFLLLWTLHMLSKNGLLSVVSRLTLSPGTADYRVGIWEWGIINIEKNPWFGLGYGQWERSSWMGESVDAHFLLLAMRHGLLVPIVMLLGILYAMIRLGLSTPYLAPRDRALAIGLNIGVMNFVLVGQTVNYFGSGLIVFMAVLGILASASSWASQQKSRALRQQVLEITRQSRARTGLPLPV